jgi:hypothetical protein
LDNSQTGLKNEIQEKFQILAEGSAELQFEPGSVEAMLEEKDVKIAELKTSLQVVASMARQAHEIALTERQVFFIVLCFVFLCVLWVIGISN